jgi:hypothetical protein
VNRVDAKRWTIVALFGASTVVLVIVLATRDREAPVEGTMHTAAKRSSDPTEAAPLAASAPNTTHDDGKSVGPIAATAGTTPSSARRPNTRGKVRVHLRTNSQPRPTWSVNLDAHPPGADSTQTVFRFASLADDTLTLDDVWPGDVVLRVRSEWCKTFTTLLTVRAAETTEVTIDLDCPRAADHIELTVRSQSGAFREPMLVYCLDATGAHHGLGDVIWGWEGREMIGLFRSDVLPEGEFELRYQVSTEFAFDRGDRIRARPGDSIELVLLDKARRIDLGFRLFDAQTGERLDEFDAYWGRWNRDAAHARSRSGEIAVEAWPDGAPMQWQVTKRGYACATGTLAQSVVLDEGPTRWIRVELRRGFLLRVGACDCNADILRGAAVISDGVEVGVTNDDGVFETTLDAEPQVVDVRYADWPRCPKAQPPPADGVNRSPCGWVYFYLTRPQ